MPNPSEAAVADTWHGPYTVLGDPHPADKSRTSYHSQISSVFKVRGKKDLYIACADRWMPDAMDIPYELYEKAFDVVYDPLTSAEEKKKAADSVNCIPKENTKEADYVWLPLRFDGDMVYIDWRDEWRTEDYD